MLGNSEKMQLLISSSSPSSNQWTHQNNNNQVVVVVDDQRGSGVRRSFSNMASVAAAPPPPPPPNRVTTNQNAAVSLTDQEQKQQQQQEPMRCPRCDSSNTKFCYYNNYSLSQPRHFCKACKRYWTRGGTLRNVPVGGGCRKNKRVRRPSLNTSSSSTTTTTTTTTNNNLNHNTSSNLHEGSVNSLPSATHVGHIHDLIYGLPTNHNHNHNHNLMMNFPFSRYDLHQNPPQIHGLGLGFSSSGLVHNNNINGDNNHHQNLHDNNSNKQNFQDLISSNPIFSNYANTTCNTTTTTTTTSTTPPTISSLLASTLQMKGGGGNNFETILPSSYEEGDDLHMKGGGMFGKEVKMEIEGQNRSLNHHWSAPSQNQMDHSNIMGSSSSSSDPSLIWGSGPNLGAWLDHPSNNNNNNNHHHLGSSVPSLI